MSRELTCPATWKPCAKGCEDTGRCALRADWEARLAAARVRRDKARRKPWNRLVHRVHKFRHAELHARSCSLCRGAE